jgi:hypothetical protein
LTATGCAVGARRHDVESRFERHSVERVPQRARALEDVERHDRGRGEAAVDQQDDDLLHASAPFGRITPNYSELAISSTSARGVVTVINAKRKGNLMKTVCDRTRPAGCRRADQRAARRSGEDLQRRARADPGVEWEHSYVVGDKTFCVYRAESEDRIREHAAKSGFPRAGSAKWSR